jgi:hypothetical protein
MSGPAPLPLPPRPDLAPEDRSAGWAVAPPERPGVVRRALEIWRRTLWVAVPLAALVQGIPGLLSRILTPRNTGPNVIWIWLHTGHFPRYVPAPQATPNPLVLPISLLAIVLVPLLYVALLRVLLGSSIGAPTDARSALACGGRLLGRAIVVGLCVSLILAAIGIPFGVVFVILVNQHLWQLGLVVLAVAIVVVIAAVSLALAVLLVEGRSGFAATGRSWRLAWGAPRAVILPVGTVLLLTDAVAFLPGFVFTRLMSAGGAELLVEGLAGLVIASVLTPLTGAVITSAYLEARTRGGDGVDPGVLASTLRASDLR